MQKLAPNQSSHRVLTCDLEATAAVPRSTFNTRSPDWFGNREPLGSEAWLTRAGSHTRPPPPCPNVEGASRELPKLAAWVQAASSQSSRHVRTWADSLTAPPHSPTHVIKPKSPNARGIRAKGVVIADQPHYPYPALSLAQRILRPTPRDASVCNKPMWRVIQSSMSAHWSLLYTGGGCSVWE